MTETSRKNLPYEPPNRRPPKITQPYLGFEIDALLAASEGEIPSTHLLADAVPWFSVAHAIAEEQHFHHWELVFVEVLGEAGASRGFDLIIGNPPWVKVGWSDSSVLSELEPKLGVEEAKSATYNRRRLSVLQSERHRRFYSDHFRRSIGTVSFLSSTTVYPLLRGIQTNLFKNFLVGSWHLLARDGVGGLLHPESPFDDVHGRELRAAYYQRLRCHYQFTNELKLFADVGNQASFGINIFSGQTGAPHFDSIFNLLTPSVVSSCRHHVRPEDPIPGIKNDEGKWNLRPHCERLVTIGPEELELFGELLEDSPQVPSMQARLARVHAGPLLKVLRQMTHSRQRLRDLEGGYYATELFHEANSQRDGIITRVDSPSYHPETVGDWVLSGPHFYVGTPLYKSPHTTCTTHRAYDELDLTAIDADFLPRAVYRPGDRKHQLDKFKKAIPKWPDSATTIMDFYRYVNRRRISPSTERTLAPAIMPKYATHMDGGFSVTFKDARTMVSFAASNCSVLCDFLVRITGKTGCRHEVLSLLPIFETPFCAPLVNRGLRLNCLTRAYADLWRDVASDEIRQDCWASQDIRLNASTSADPQENGPCDWPFELAWSELDPTEWSWRAPLRTDYARRQALLEIDVLVAIALGLSCEELCSVYRVQFPVMRLYELEDEYDARGRRVPNSVRKDRGAGAVRDAIAKNGLGQPLTVSWEVDDGLQTVTKTFYPPFTKVDREGDYARVWKAFEERYGEE